MANVPRIATALNCQIVIDRCWKKEF